MRRIWIVAMLGALVLAAGCRTPGHYRAAVAMTNVAAETAYGVIYSAWRDDLIDTADMDRAAVIYDRYTDAANAMLDAVLTWEAMVPGQPWAPADVLVAARRTTALVAALEALAVEVLKRERTSRRMVPQATRTVSRRDEPGARTTRRRIWATASRKSA